tara:strand:+ start:39302 stop:40132 length:831 start_codon:yes stop_codon:yes gene_type:complete
MRLKRTKISLLIMIILISVAWVTWYKVEHSGDRARLLVEQQTKHLIVIDKEFPAIANLEGFLVHFKDSPDNQAIIYADKQGRYLIMGHIIDNKGMNITMKETSQMIRSPQNIKAYQDAQHLHWILQGTTKAKHVITVIVDPNNPLFPKQYKMLETDVANGEIAVRWVIVNYLKPFGAKTAAAILQAPDPAKALAQAANHYDVKTQSAGIKASMAVKPSTQQQLDSNWNFMQKYKLNSTPISIFKLKNGRVYLVKGLLMDEMLEGVIEDSENNSQSE